MEENSTKIPILNKLLNSGARTTTSAASPDPSEQANSLGELFLMNPVAASVDAGKRNGRMQ